jgi:hypothetical protein
MKCPSTACPCNAQNKPNAWKCQFFNIWLYLSVPDKLRVAKLADFYQGARPRFGMPYLVKSFYEDVYHALKFSSNTNVNEFTQFIEAGHVYIDEIDKRTY